MTDPSGPIIVHAHSGYVQGPIGGQGVHAGWFFAVCSSCGWQAGANRPTREEAERDLTNHVSTTGVGIA